MSQKDTILDVLRRAQQPLQPKITKKAGETPAARRPAKEKGERPNRARGEERKRSTARKQGLRNFGRWLSGDFSMPRAGLYLGIFAGILLAFGAYKIGVRRGGMGGTAYGMQKNQQMARVPALNERKQGQAKRDQGNLDQQAKRVSGDLRTISEISPGGKPGVPPLPRGASSKKVPMVAPKTGSEADKVLANQGSAVQQKPMQVLRLLSNPDNNDSRMKIQAMRDWLRRKLDGQSSSALRSVKVYFWLSRSSRPGGNDSACLEVTIPEGWTQARLMRELALLGRVSEDGFVYDFGEIRNNSMGRKRLPSEISQSLQQEKLGH